MKSSGWVLAGVLFLASASLHVVNWTSAGPLWRDEAAFMNVSTAAAWSKLWQDSAFDSFPICPYALARLWADLVPGKTDLGLRFGGLLVGLSILAALGWTAWQMRAGPPWLSLALLGFSAVVIRWGDALRGYGLGMLFIIMTFALTWKVARSPRKRWWCAACVAATLSAQCLYSNPVLLAAIGVGAMAVCLRHGDWRGVFRVGTLCAVAAATLLPYAGQVLARREWNALMEQDFTVTVFWQRLTAALNGPTSFMVWVWVGFGALAFGVAGLAIFRARPDENVSQSDISIYAGLTLAAGLVGYLVFLKVLRYGRYDWHYVALMALIAVAIDTVLSTSGLARRLGGLGLALGAWAIAACCWSGAWPAVHVRQTNIDRVAAALEKRAGAEDLILVDPWFLGISFSRYYHGPAAWETLPAIEDKSVHRYDLLKRKMMEVDPIDMLLTRVSETLRAGHRVWVVGWPRFVKKGEDVEHLPPAPAGPFGWHDPPYSRVWSRQLTSRLQMTARSGALVRLPGNAPVREDTILVVFEGT